MLFLSSKLHGVRKFQESCKIAIIAARTAFVHLSFVFCVFFSRQMKPPRRTVSRQHRLYLKAQIARPNPRDFMSPTSPSGSETQISGKCSV